MAIVVVGGHARKVGKTSVVEGLIGAFSIYPWTAVKISSHLHLSRSMSEGSGNSFEIHSETSRQGSSDSSRYLAAGAARSFLVSAPKGSYDAAVRRLVSMVQSDPFLIVESNRIVNFLKADLCIVVLRCDVEDFKDSAREMLASADAAVAVNCTTSSPRWRGIPPDALSKIPVFPVTASGNLTRTFLDFAQTRLFPR